MLVKNVSGVTLRCTEFGIRPFAMQPDEIKDIPDAVARLWLNMNEKPVELVGKTSSDEDLEAALVADVVEDLVEDDIVDDEPEVVEDDEEVSVDESPEDVVPRKRNRR